MASTSGVPKGRRPRGGQSSPATARSAWSSRRPFPSAAQPRDLGVAVVALALLQRRLGGQQSPLLPFRQPRRRDVELPCHQLQWFAPQQPAHRPQLPLRREALARRRTCLRQLLGGAPTSPPAPSCPPPSFRPFGSPSFAVRLTAAECLNQP